MKLGAYDYITKPLYPDAVIARLEKALEKRRLDLEMKAAVETPRILVVDDEAIVCRALADVLGDEGYRVTTVQSAYAALERMRQETFDILIADLKLPDLNGIELIAAARGIDPEIMALVITGYPSIETAVDAIKTSAYDYITKPIDPDLLVATVRRGWERQRLAILNKQLLTRLQRTNKELRESEARYRLLVENANDAIFALDSDLRVTDVNPFVEQAGGYSRDELIGRSFPELGVLAPESLGPVIEDVARVLARERVSGAVYEFIAKDGQHFLGEVSGAPIYREGRVVGVLAIARDITERKRAEEKLQRSFEKLQRALEGTVHTLVSTTDMRDPYTAGHQRRVTQLACAIANEMGTFALGTVLDGTVQGEVQGLPEERIEGLRMAGLIHDLGKMNIPAEILSKPGPLNGLQYGLIKNHVQVGHDVLSGAMDFPWPLAQIVLQHHERMDGSGYPQGLAGEDILLEARILGVADVVEAMASHRPYRSALGIDKALEEISRNRGVLYDPEVVDVCLKLFTEKGFKFE